MEKYPKIKVDKKYNPHRRLQSAFTTTKVIEARYMNTTIWTCSAIVSVAIYLAFSLSSFNNLLNVIIMLILARNCN